MITIAAILIVFGLIVFIHEFGHFFVAKMLGVRVEKFSLGFGPKLFGFKKGDTEYLVCVLPLGGYVRLAGSELDTPLKNEPWEFLSQSPWKRNLIVLAGPLMNLFLAVFLFSMIALSGIPMLTSKVGEIKKGFPAEAAGLLPNDAITAIDGKPVKLWEDLVAIVYENGGKEMEFTIQRSPQGAPHPGASQPRIWTVKIIPKLEVMKDIFGKERKIGLIGITPTAEVIARKESLLPAIGSGVRMTVMTTWLTYKGLWLLITRQVPANSIGGPLMIAKLAGESAKKGFIQLLYFMCIISVTLAVINLLPIPVLDGGHLVFFTIEGLKGSPVSLRVQEMSQTAGIVFLVALMLFATYNDIVRFFS